MDRAAGEAQAALTDRRRPAARHSLQSLASCLSERGGG